MSRDVIRSNIESANFDVGGHLGLEERSYFLYDLDLDTYEDLISVEICLKDLIKKNLFSNLEKSIIGHLLDGRRISEIESLENLSRPTVVKKIIEVANRISYHLGYHFTDQGYLDYLTEKYDLDEIQIEKLEKIIKEET